MNREIGLDVRGRPCPIPVLELARAIRRAEVGDVIRLSADDPAAEGDILAWCQATGHLLVHLVHEGTELRAEIRKARSA